ncbi:tripartite tricarboxylate transporter substrate binding protein [Virgibacillus ndiopensis]|uniref:tripartite tricarboxylate transporter substrate binding protein n=1 Tax=Virgibacillus ndiopensis TaxID=2004408 RepID=UPI000C080995|nr:tripartite tricarboxylate transporter substrate binding protein [Virgibacillus ndiopensis]
MKTKSIFQALIMVVFSLVLLVGCNGNEESSAKNGNDQESSGDYPNKPINIIVAYAAGGGTDTGARILQPFLEEELGVSVNIINKAGGGGWVGWGELANAEPDGYTLGFINTPNLMTGYLNPNIERKENLSSFVPLANQVSDFGAIAINPDDDRFSNIKELIEYAKTHELTATSTGVGSDDHYASLKLNAKYGTKFVPVHNSGAADSKAQVLGGHTDVLFANVGETFTAHQNGEIKILATMSEERSEFLPDIPTLAEAGYPDVYSWSARGLAAPSGISEEKVEILREALKKAITNPDHIKKMKDMGLAVNFQAGQAYMDLLKSDEEDVKELIDLVEW